MAAKAVLLLLGLLALSSMQGLQANSVAEDLLNWGEDDLEQDDAAFSEQNDAEDEASEEEAREDEPLVDDDNTDSTDFETQKQSLIGEEFNDDVVDDDELDADTTRVAAAAANTTAAPKLSFKERMKQVRAENMEKMRALRAAAKQRDAAKAAAKAAKLQEKRGLVGNAHLENSKTRQAKKAAKKAAAAAKKQAELAKEAAKKAKKLAKKRAIVKAKMQRKMQKRIKKIKKKEIRAEKKHAKKVAKLMAKKDTGIKPLVKTTPLTKAEKKKQLKQIQKDRKTAMKKKVKAMRKENKVLKKASDVWKKQHAKVVKQAQKEKAARKLVKQEKLDALKSAERNANMVAASTIAAQRKTVGQKQTDTFSHVVLDRTTLEVSEARQKKLKSDLSDCVTKKKDLRAQLTKQQAALSAESAKGSAKVKAFTVATSDLTAAKQDVAKWQRGIELCDQKLAKNRAVAGYYKATADAYNTEVQQESSLVWHLQHELANAQNATARAAIQKQITASKTFILASKKGMTQSDKGAKPAEKSDRFWLNRRERNTVGLENAKDKLATLNAKYRAVAEDYFKVHLDLAEVQSKTMDMRAAVATKAHQCEHLHKQLKRVAKQIKSMQKDITTLVKDPQVTGM